MLFQLGKGVCRNVRLPAGFKHLQIVHMVAECHALFARRAQPFKQRAQRLALVGSLGAYVNPVVARNFGAQSLYFGYKCPRRVFCRGQLVPYRNFEYGVVFNRPFQVVNLLRARL